MIDPLNLPKAAGLDFAEGDVKHLAPGDEMSSTSIGQATRNLAERDNILSDKVNQVVDIVNNKEQFINLPTMKIILPPLTEEVITNYRIPPGFEARVLNAIVNSSPADIVKLEIFFSASFGAQSGESLVSTLGEFTGETKFHGNGEFIVKLTNIGSVSAETVASIIMTMRPVSEPFGSLVGAGAQGDPGPQGPKGDKGDRGLTGGPGAQGGSGINWRGAYSFFVQYATNDAVRFAEIGHSSAYIAVAPNIGTLPKPLGGPWDILAEGVTGASGSSFSPSFIARSIFGTIVTAGDYTPGAATGSYLSVGTGTFPMTFNEFVMGGAPGIPSGIASTFHTRLMTFRGTALVLIPGVTDGGAVDYGVNDTVANVASHTPAMSVFVTKIPPRGFAVSVSGTVPANVSLSFQAVAPLA